MLHLLALLGQLVVDFAGVHTMSEPPGSVGKKHTDSEPPGSVG